MNRRRFLAGACGVGATTAGCPAGVPGVRGPRDDPTPGYPGEVPWEGTPPEWSRDTDCTGMHDSVVTVQWATDSLRDAFAPLRFAELTPGERDVAWTALRDGGYASCDPSAAFDRFLDRVSDHYATQSADGGPSVVHLAYRGRYYGLYVEREDVVISG